MFEQVAIPRWLASLPEKAMLDARMISGDSGFLEHAKN